MPWNKGKKLKPLSEETRKKISEALKGKKKSEEQAERLRNLQKGRKHGEDTKRKMREAKLGKKKTKETREKMSKAQKGKRLSEETKRKLSESHKGQTPWMTGRKHTEEARKKMSAAHKGKKTGKDNHDWKGGITKLTVQIRSCLKYRQWRSDILTRDDYTCQECWEKSGKLHVDHYPESFAEIFHKSGVKTLVEALDHEPFWNLNNGRTLCVPCHELTETYKKRYDLSV